MVKQEKNKKERIILVNIIVFLLGFAIADLIIGQFLIPYNYNLFRIKHPYYHHGLMPNVNHYAAWGKHLYSFHTNSVGLRDSIDKEIPKKSDKKRILILGDSHSEGVGVEFNSTFAGILQKQCEKLPYEILNASAVSYSPKIHFLKADYLINTINLEIEEIWLFIDISDLQNEIAYEKFIPAKPLPFFTFKTKLKKFFEKNSFVYNTINSRKQAKVINRFVNKMDEFEPEQLQKMQKNTVELYEDFFRDFDDDDLLRSPEFHGVGEWYYNPAMIPLAQKGLELGQKNIEKLHSLCDAKGIKLVLAIHPWHSQIFKQQKTDYYTMSWEKFCAKTNIEFINMFPVFINEENPYSVVKRYYIPNDNHWNEEGHKKVADFLFQRLN